MTSVQAPPRTPASEMSVYYDADSNEGAHSVHAKDSVDTITQKHNDDAPVNGHQTGGADVTRKPSVATGALEPREPTSGGILSKKSADQGQEPTTNVRDSGFSQGPISHDKGKSVAFADPDNQSTHDQPSPAYESTRGREGQAPNALPDIKAPPRASTLLGNEKSGGGRGSVDEDKPLNDNSASVQRTSTGAFAKGAAVTGPNARPADIPSQHQRAETAESHLSEKQKAKLSKAEREFSFSPTQVCMLTEIDLP